MKKKWVVLTVIGLGFITFILFISIRSADNARRNTDIILEKFMRTNKELQESLKQPDSPRVQPDQSQKIYK